MKRNLLIFLSCFMLLDFVEAQEDATRDRCDYKLLIPENPCDEIEEGNWVYVLKEDFGDGMLDLSNWFTCFDGYCRNGACNLQYYLDQNIEIHDDMLSLWAKEEPGEYNVYENGCFTPEYLQYTSGMLETKHYFKYGLFEIRCKIPKGVGLWPAFWLFGNGGELDIFEFAGRDPTEHHMTLHNWNCPDASNSHCFCSKTKDYGVDFSEGFHTFAAKWNEFKVVFFVDDDIKRIYYNYYTRLLWQGVEDCNDFDDNTLYHVCQEFPTTPQRLITNLAIASGDTGLGDFIGPPNATVTFPKSMDIDYIKVYRRANPNRDVTFSGPYDYDVFSSAITGRNVMLGGNSQNLNIDSFHAISIVATNSISLLPGFCVEKGAGFMARCNTAEECRSTLADDNDEFFQEESVMPRIEKTDNKEMILEYGEDKMLKTENGSLFDNQVYQLFPNPTNGTITVNVANNTYSIIRVFSINGILLEEKDGVGGIFQFDFSTKSKGMYIIQINNEDISYFHKIIVE